MELRQLGRSDIEASRIILGCGNFGGIGSAPQLFGRGEGDAEASAIMDAAWELGITAFDTADAYGGGRSEAAIGRWLATKGSNVRDRLTITTKTFNPMDRGGDSGLGRARILRQVETSLTRLGVERIDLYLAHAFDEATPLEETVGALDELVRAGKIRWFGASNFTEAQVEAGLRVSAERGLARFECVQSEYSLLERDAERDVLPFCAQHGLGFTAFSPLSGGWLTGKYRRGEPPPPGSRMTLRPDPYLHLEREEIWAALERLEAAAAEYGVEAAALALAWLLAEPAVAAIVVGPRRPAHLEPARAALELRLSPGERDELASFFA